MRTLDKRANPARRRRGGFTLVEMMIAMGILVVGVTSVLGLLAFGAALQRTAERRTEAALVVEQVAAELRDSLTVDASGKASEPPLQFERTISGHPNLRAKVELRRNPELDGEYFVQIAIQWLERGRFRSEFYRTILERAVPFHARAAAAQQKKPSAKY
jgi:prepilin-type N-terminal cleavage/methylation domain-containing protein